MASGLISRKGRWWSRRSESRNSDVVVCTGLSRKYRNDLYLFLLEASWPGLVMVLGLLYVVANAVFALGYVLGGDSIENARPGSFADAFFFSVQTMATIGFGKMVPRTPLANVLVTIESMTGLLGLAIATGLIFAKFSRPTAHVLFSRVAVISPWDGVPSLMFRMANERNNRIIEAQVHAVLMRIETTAENVLVRRVHRSAVGAPTKSVLRFELDRDSSDRRTKPLLESNSRLTRRCGGRDHRILDRPG